MKLEDTVATGKQIVQKKYKEKTVPIPRQNEHRAT